MSAKELVALVDVSERRSVSRPAQSRSLDQWAAMHTRLVASKVESWLDRAARELTMLRDANDLDPVTLEDIERLEHSVTAARAKAADLLASLPY